VPKIVPFDPNEMTLTRDLEAVIQGHVKRLARYQLDDETPVASAETEHLMLRTMISLLSEIIMEGRGLKWALIDEHFFGIGGRCGTAAGVALAPARQVPARLPVQESGCACFWIPAQDSEFLRFCARSVSDPGSGSGVDARSRPVRNPSNP
jgi:hypothetical protein